MVISMKAIMNHGRSLIQCRILEEIIEAENNAVWFGMTVMVNEKIVCVYHSLSQKYEQVEALITAINSGCVSFSQLEFIMDDWLGSLAACNF